MSNGKVKTFLVMDDGELDFRVKEFGRGVRWSGDANCFVVGTSNVASGMFWHFDDGGREIQIKPGPVGIHFENHLLPFAFQPCLKSSM